ncbi:MAG: hypothetical protein JO164_03880, partial [Candidatus Eremiobacteraeota bacterium]|nr:hypothetical protein [Candidatus Eremiobacteraeota bacterium]
MTAPPPANPPLVQPPGFDALLARAWTLFRTNPVLMVVTAIMYGAILVPVAGFAAVVIVASLRAGGDKMSSDAAGTFVGGVMLGALLLVLIVIVVAIWGTTAMFGMADAAWERGTTRLADGFAAFRRSWVAMLVANLLLIVLGVAAVLLAIPTLGIALLALPLFTMYVIPAVVSGGHDGYSAIGESFRLVRRKFWPSVLGILVLIAIQYGISFLAVPFLIPFELAVGATASTAGPASASLPTFSPAAIMLGVIGAVVMTVAYVAYHAFYALTLTGLY